MFCRYKYKNFILIYKTFLDFFFEKIFQRIILYEKFANRFRGLKGGHGCEH